MKVTKKTINATMIACCLSLGTVALAEDDMMGSMGNQAPMTDTTDADQMSQDHEQMKKDHEMMMKGHKGGDQQNTNKMGKKKPMPSQNSGGGMMNHPMGTGASPQSNSNSMGGGMSDM